MRFETPFALLLLLLTPLVLEHSWRSIFFNTLRLRVKTPESDSLRFSSPVDISSLPVSPRAKLFSPLISLLRAAVFISLVIALARPQAGSAFIENEMGGRDLMLVLDTSGSMQALDFKLDGSPVRRIDALKSVVGNFIEQRTGDRLGLVVFGSDVYTQCPLTLDHSMLQTYVDNLDIGMAGDSTSLGEAIIIAVKHIKDIKADSKAMVLVTDGKQTSGSIQPLEAAEIAKEHHIKIYSIGIGGHEPAPFKVKDAFGREQIIRQDVPLDEDTLMEVSKKTGGIYFNATKTEELQNIYQEINRLEERKEVEQTFVEYEELFLYPAAFGFICFILLQILQRTVFRIIP